MKTYAFFLVLMLMGQGAVGQSAKPAPPVIQKITVYKDTSLVDIDRKLLEFEKRFETRLNEYDEKVLSSKELTLNIILGILGLFGAWVAFGIPYMINKNQQSLKEEVLRSIEKEKIDVREVIEKEKTEAGRAREAMVKSMQEKFDLELKQKLEEMESRMVSVRNMEAEYKNRLDKIPADKSSEPENKEVIREVKEDPNASDLDKARADAFDFQAKGLNSEAIVKWEEILKFPNLSKENIAQAVSAIGVNYGFLHEKTKDEKYINEAINWFTVATKLGIKSERAHYNLGLMYSRLKKHEKAIEEYTLSINIDSKYQYPWTNRGNSYYELGNYEEAIRNYNESLSIEERSMVYRNRAEAFARLNKDQESKIDIKKAEALEELEKDNPL